jgi:hypothetical protein
MKSTAMSNTLPASQAEYDTQMRLLEEEAENARKDYIEAKARYDRICDNMRDLRVAWREEQNSAAPPMAQHTKPTETGLVLKGTAFPDRIKPHRGRHTHAATYAPGPCHAHRMQQGVRGGQRRPSV